MKRHFFLRCWALVAGVCLLLAGILSGSLGWATASSSVQASVASGSGGNTSPRTRSQGAHTTGAGPSRFLQTSKVSENVSADPATAVRRAWELARGAGACRFATELV